MQLTTPRLLLREFVESDWQDTLEYQQDPLYLRYYEWEKREKPAVQQLITMFINWKEEVPRHKYQFALCLAGQTRLIGNCGIRKDTVNSLEADIGYELAPAYWGHGYATEAARRIVRFGFEELGVERITAECVEENIASRRVMEKVGLVFSHRRESRLWFKSRDWTTLVYAIDRADFLRQGSDNPPQP